MSINLVKLENDLKNAPDQALISYVQNPTGQVPTYLALSELERRKRMRQGAVASQGGEQPTVADQMIAEAAPQQPMEGVASLPVPDSMYSAAEGGIVGYAGGGMVAFDEGGPVLSPEEIARLSPTERDAYYARQQAKLKDAGMGYLGAVALPFKSGYKVLENAALGGMDLYGGAVNELLGRSAIPPRQTTQATQQIQDKTSIAPLVEQQPSRPEQENVTLPDGSVVNKAAFLRSQQGIQNLVQQTPPDDTGAAPRRDSVPSGPGITGIAGLPTWEDYKPKTLDESIYDKRLAAEPSMDATRSERDKMREAYGIPLDPYGAQRSELADERKALEGQKDRNIGQFLMELGGRFASTPGPSGAALGESLMKATPGLVANQKDLRKEQRDLRRESSELERLENARREALMSGDRDEFLRKDKEYNDFLDKKQQRVDKNIEAVNAADLTNRKVRYDTKLKGWEVTTKEAGDTTRTAMQVAASREGSAATRESNQLYREVAQNRDSQEARIKYIDKAFPQIERDRLNAIETKLAKDKKYKDEAEEATHIQLMSKYEKVVREAEEMFPLVSNYSGEYGKGAGGLDGWGDPKVVNK
jgi:hypothetical protein